MAPPVSLQDECEPLWKGYRFRSPSKEDQYRDKWQTPMVQVCQIWCLVHLVMDGLVPIPNLFEISKVGLGHAFSLSFVPSLALAVTTLFLVSFVPWCRRHIVTVTSIASVLMAALTAAMVHTHTDLWIHHSQQRDLSLVVNRVAGDEEAMAQLQTFLTNQFSSYQIWKNLLLRTGLEVLLLSYVGVYQSTVVAMILVSAVLCTIFSWSPLIPLWAAVKGSMVVVVVIVWVLLVGRLWTKSRRHSFLLERFFEEALKVAVNASRHADSILNHTLKNTMADAASDVELFLEGLEAGTGAIDETHLQKAAASLWRGMRSCRNRQAYLNLVAGKYCIALQSTHLTKFVEELTVGRNVRVDVPDEVVCIDERLCNLILDNALSNAFKHGHPKHPDVQLSIQVSQCIPSPDKAQLTATVTNVSHPARPAVTPEYVAKVLAGEAQLGPTTSAISDRIGLQHSFMAAETMGADLKLTQTGQQVAFVIQLEVEVADHVPAKSSADSHSGAATVVFPCDLCICCIDDSEAARRLLHHHLVTLANTKQVHMFGANEEEVEEFKRTSLATGHIAILDQHLEYGGNSNILGTDIIADLVAQGFTGLVCMRSGNTADEDVEMYKAAGAHCVFGKDVPVKQMIAELKVAYHQHIAKPKVASESALLIEDAIEVQNSDAYIFESLPGSPMAIASSSSQPLQRAEGGIEQRYLARYGPSAFP